MSNQQTIAALKAARMAIDDALSALEGRRIDPLPAAPAGGSDLLHGVEAIGIFLGLKKRQAQHWLDTTDISVIRTGRTVSARRSDLDRWLAGRVG